MDKLTLKTPAKLNLYLNILCRRRDGFHNIQSIVERISLFDKLKIFLLKKEGDIDFYCDDKSIPLKDNLAYKALVLFKRQFKIKRGIRVFLKKSIPKGSGLGGASSDAAGVILGLNKLLGLELAKKTLYRLGSQLGSDVNFFLSQESFALLEGRGEKVKPVKSDLKLRHILITLPWRISTSKVYELFNAELTKYLDNVKLIIYSLERKDRELLEVLLFNGLAKFSFKLVPRMKKIVDFLGEQDLAFNISGSGSALYILKKEKKLSRRIKDKLSKWGLTFKEVSTV